MVFIYTVLGIARDGRANWGRRHQVLGGSEWLVRCGGGGIKDACLVAVRLLCMVRLSHFSFSVCRRGFQAVLRNRPSSLFILFGCISISMASLMSRSEYPVLVERSLVSCNLMMWSRLKLCAATADYSCWASLMCLSCSLMHRWMDRPLCPM
jgi:hypothetical protein